MTRWWHVKYLNRKELKHAEWYINHKFGKVDGSFGVWVNNPGYYNQYGGQSINLTQFWKAVDGGMSYEKASLKPQTQNPMNSMAFRVLRKLPSTNLACVLDVIAKELSCRSMLVGDGMLDNELCRVFDSSGSGVMVEIGRGIPRINRIYL